MYYDVFLAAATGRNNTRPPRRALTLREKAVRVPSPAAPTNSALPRDTTSRCDSKWHSPASNAFPLTYVPFRLSASRTIQRSTRPAAGSNTQCLRLHSILARADLTPKRSTCLRPNVTLTPVHSSMLQMQHLNRTILSHFPG